MVMTFEPSKKKYELEFGLVMRENYGGRGGGLVMGGGGAFSLTAGSLLFGLISSFLSLFSSEQWANDEN